MQLGPFLAESVPGMGILGGIVGTTNAIAKNVERVSRKTVSGKDALLDIGQEGFKNGLATALTFAAVGSIGGELIVSVGATLIIGSTLKYLWDRGFEQAAAPARAPTRRMAGPAARRPVSTAPRTARRSAVTSPIFAARRPVIAADA